MTIALSHADGACEPATLAIEPATSYTVSCASPALTGCIEKDQRVTVSHVPASAGPRGRPGPHARLADDQDV